jgi:hypothetical protein
MCGIVGIVGRNGARIDPGQVAAMRDTMRHRGPDDEGLWQSEDGRVVLGHRRLAIIDLSPAGRAPIGNEDGSVQVTFNGEIYNHAALREDLRARGHTFRSRCDTEVLVHLWEEHGPRMVDRLVGMFAFVIWDGRRRQTFAARDRLGIKPLYWLDDGNRFAFASEIKGLLPLLHRREIDPVALSHYLTFVAVPPPRTLFAGVSKLAPATTLLVREDGTRLEERYWDPIGNRAQFDGEIDDWEAELLFRLERSVDRRMMSDVPVGVFLSGGVDSSTNVALMSQVAEGPVNTFSIGYHDAPEFNEFTWARRIAQQFGTNHHEVMIDADDLWRSSTIRTSRSPIPSACPCTSSPSSRRTTASPWCRSARVPMSFWPATRRTSRRRGCRPSTGPCCARCHVPCSGAWPVRGRWHWGNAPTGASTSRRYAAPRSRMVSCGGAAPSRSTSKALTASRPRTCAASSTARGLARSSRTSAETRTASARATTSTA